MRFSSYFADFVGEGRLISVPLVSCLVVGLTKQDTRADSAGWLFIQFLKGSGHKKLMTTRPSPEKFFLDWPAWAGRLMLLFSRAWRLRVVNQPPPDAGGVMVHWHGDDLVLTPTMRHMNTAILVSPSRDGDRLGRALTALGHQPCRGSSARSGADGLLALKRALAEGRNAVFAADGPRGPRLVAKPGPAFLAAKTGRPLYPAGVAVSRAYVFRKSWHQTRLPLPGARVVVVFGPPLRFPPEAARWPAHHLSRLAGAALADAVLAAETALGPLGPQAPDPIAGEQ
jgi:lysophospholipid acyltransferase (LPLAT)-like uncharacterized protein